jgi:CHAD domain-containing protein
MAPSMHTTFAHASAPAADLVDTLAARGFAVDRAGRRACTILDTFDGRLHAAGLRLERREGSPATLVLSDLDRGGDQPQDPPASLPWAPSLAWPSELPPGPFRDRLVAVTRERALVPLFSLSSAVCAVRRVDRRGKTLALVEVHEDVEVDGVDPDALELPAWVAQVVPVVGHTDTTKLAGALEQEGFTTSPDVVTLAAASAGVALSGHRSSASVPLAADDDAGDAFRRVLANLADTIDANLAGTLADTDPEFLHELRVAIRRTRSVLAQSKGVLPKGARTRYGESFRWLGLITTPPRDLDVYLLGWEGYVAPLSPDDATALAPVRDELARRREAAHDDLARDLTSKRARKVLAEWSSWLARTDHDGVRPTIGAVAADRVAHLHARLLRDGRAIGPDTHADRLHDLRKDAKKLRYMLECFADAFPAKPRQRFVRHLKALQDNLGEHQDAEVHLEQLGALARDLPRTTVGADTLVAMEHLTGHLDERRQRERDRFADEFGAFDTKANQKTLDKMVQKARGA